jgi:hypothetical protein
MHDIYEERFKMLEKGLESLVLDINDLSVSISDLSEDERRTRNILNNHKQRIILLEQEQEKK